MAGGFTPSLRWSSDNVTPEAEFLASEHIMAKRIGMTLAQAVVPADADGNRIVKKGTLVTRITAAGPDAGKFGPYAAGASEVQTINLGAATAGSITITFDGETTGAIAFNATAATVQAALDALSNVSPGDITVSGGPLPGTITLTFGGRYAGVDVPQVTVTPTGLTGGTVTVTTTTAGGSAVTDGRQNLDPDDSGYLFESVNLRYGDTIAGILTHGSVLEARVSPAITTPIRTALAGRITFQ